MSIHSRLARLEAREPEPTEPRFIVVMRSERDAELITGLSGVPFEREQGESWPDYSRRAERYAAGVSPVFITIARYRGD